MRELSRPLGPRQKVACGAFCLAAIGILIWLDMHQGDELTISLFYLVPIGLATWFIGRWAGLVLALLSAGLWLVADLNRPSGPYTPRMSFWADGSELGFTLALALTLAALRNALDREKTLARLAPLTGVANRRGFYDVAERELARARRHALPLTLVYMDLDEFKAVNDRFGHQTGDRLLRTVADTLRRHLRATDLVARLGGDEFALLLFETSLSAARDPLDTLHRALRDAMRAHQWPVTFSIGAVSFPTPPDSVDRMIHEADTLMYTVKNGGKDRLTQSEDGR